jgi:pectate lyase
MKIKLAKLLLITAIIVTSVHKSYGLNINKQVGWLESAYFTWAPVAEATSYNVYYTGEGISDKKIDTQLIRNYGTYFRADVPGLKPGSYVFTVKAVNSSNVEFDMASCSAVNVLGHDRTGFAFSNGRVPGAYKSDGTIKENALILYITQKTKNTVTTQVTTSSKGTTTSYTGLQNILNGFKKGYDTRPLIVRMVGQITDLNDMLGGDIVIENNNNSNSYISLEGIGDDAVADGWGIRIKNGSNVEVRNIGIINCDSDEGDNIGLQQNNDHIWIHNCDFFYGNAGSDADQIKGDGALDCKKSNYVTFSYNHFWDNGKCNLLGLSEGTYDLFITYHHNWYDHSDSRHPRVRYYSAHVYNNYYDGNAKYGVGATLGSSVFVEKNYFRNCKYPILTSMQGTDVWNASTQQNEYKNMPVFSKENGGSIKAYDNFMTGQARFVGYGSTGYVQTTTVDFDAYVAASRDEVVPNTVKSAYGANTYNNFDTNPSIIYPYIADSPEQAKENVTAYSGRFEGGDLKFTFNNAVDDASYAVNNDLKSKILNYKTNLVNVQGEDKGTDETGTITLTLTSGLQNQTISLGETITPIVFTAGGSATSIIAEDIPDGLIYSVENLTLTISGTPTAINSTTYTVTASDATSSKALTGTVTVKESGSHGSDEDPDKAAGLCEIVDAGSNSGFAIAGNTSTSKGSVTINGTTYSCCLKMESGTSITFSTTSDKILTLFFLISETGKKVKIDGNTYTTNSEGKIVLELSAGTHTITKGDSASLFYISLKSGSTSGITTVVENQSSIYYKNGIILNPNNDNIQVINSFGKIIYTGNGGASLKNRPRGIYFIRLIQINKTSKIIW